MAPTNPTFNLGSTSGYTTSISTNYYTYGSAVQTDNVTLDLNGNALTTPALNVATANGQTGSLAPVGPGTLNLLNENNGSPVYPGDVYFGTGGGVGQLTVNGATIETTGGKLSPNSGPANSPSKMAVYLTCRAFHSVQPLRVFTDGLMNAPFVPLGFHSRHHVTNGSSISDCGSVDELNINGAYLDDSTIHATEGGTIFMYRDFIGQSSLQMQDQVIVAMSMAQPGISPPV